MTTVQGGTAKNVIPRSVLLGGTVRTLAARRRTELREAIERIVRGVTEAHRATYRFDTRSATTRSSTTATRARCSRRGSARSSAQRRWSSTRR